MAYGSFKDLIRRTITDKILRDKVFNVAENLRYGGYQQFLPLIVYKIFDDKDS